MYLVIFFQLFFASTNITKTSWGDNVDVVWVENDRLPIFYITINFKDGALSDTQGGLTSTAFEGLTWGTNRHQTKEINDFLDYYAARINTETTHEYASIHISGLNNYLIPVVKMACHLITDSTYPKEELTRTRDRHLAKSKNLITNPSRLGDKIFRELSLSGTPYYYPTEGKNSDFAKLNSKVLRSKMNYFVNDVKKTIYISGSSDVLKIKDIIMNECKFNSGGNFTRKVETVTKPPLPKIYFAKLPNATQSTILMGKYLPLDSISSYYKMTLADKFLSGPEKSLFYEELRTKRGLVYTPYASVSRQKEYGRVLIMNSTKNENTVELIELVKSLLGNLSNDDIFKERLTAIKDSITGTSYFEYEHPKGLLSLIQSFNDLLLPLDEITNLASNINKISEQDVLDYMKSIFKDDLTILVLGHESILKDLQKNNQEVEVVNINRFL